MSTIRFSKLLFISFLFLSLLVLSGCSGYRTVKVAPTGEAINTVFKYRKNVLIYNFDRSEEYLLRDLVITKDFISGNILPAPEGWKHEPMDKSSRQKNHTPRAHETLSTMHIYSSVDEINLGEFSLPITNISKVEIQEEDQTKSVLITLAVVVAIGTFLVISSSGGGYGGGYSGGGGGGNNYSPFSWNCSGLVCPLVESYGIDLKKFHGSLFPGAIFKSLKRDDYLFLTDYVSNQGKLNLKVFNNFPEVEYIDQLTLLQINHQGFDKLGLNNNNKIVAYNRPVNAITAIGGQESITHLLAEEDGEVYDFDDATVAGHLNSLTLEFNRQDLSNQPYLVIKGKQSQWLEMVTDFTLYNIGSSFDDWVKTKDNDSGEEWKKKNVRQGVSLNIYLKKNNKWIYIGSHHDAGTLAMRNLLIGLNLENIDSPNIEIKLECAFKLWEIDYVGLTNEWSEDLALKELDFSSVKDENGKDVSMRIKNNDGLYHIQNNSGTFIELEAKGILEQSNSSIVLHGSGYFHPIKNYEHQTNHDFISNMDAKSTMQDLSLNLYHYKQIMSFASTD